MRKRLFFGLLVVVLAFAGTPQAWAKMSEEQKKRLFLRAREDTRPIPLISTSPTPQPRPRAAATPDAAEPVPEPSKTSRRAHRVHEERVHEERVHEERVHEERVHEERVHEEPAHASTPEETPQETSRESSQKTSRESRKEPSRRKASDDDHPKAPIHIEKSGLMESKGLVPAPKYSSGWFSPRWPHLSRSVRKAIDRAHVRKGRWKYIVVHNSGTRQGNARIFDTYHRRVRKMPNGLAYHFVIGNGTDSGDGEIEIGSRWTKQINGGHVASDYLNNIALGICLVGDFNRDKPTKAQLAALEELIEYLRRRVGKVDGKPAIVIPHKLINPKPTDCPGKNFPYRWLKEKFGS